MKSFEVVVLISGRGSNLKSLVESRLGYEIVAVVSDQPEAPGLQYAQDAGIETIAIPRSKFPSRAAHKREIFSNVNQLGPDLVALAGFMLIVPPEFVEPNYGRIVNIHPSLLPAFPGLDTHKQAISAGVTEHGCSVHYVDSGVDTGPVIAQARCECYPTDTPETLAARVLTSEHKLYPWVVSQISGQQIRFDSEGPIATKECARSAEEHNFVFGSTVRVCY